MQNLINARHVLVSYCVFELAAANDLLKKKWLEFISDKIPQIHRKLIIVP